MREQDLDKTPVGLQTTGGDPGKPTKAVHNLGSLFLEKLMMRKLIKWVNKNICTEWGQPPNMILLHLKLKENGDPFVSVSDVPGRHFKELNTHMGSFDDIAKLAFKKVLHINKIMADDWKIEKHEVFMVLQIVEGKAVIRIINGITQEVRIV